MRFAKAKKVNKGIIEIERVNDRIYMRKRPIKSSVNIATFDKGKWKNVRY